MVIESKLMQPRSKEDQESNMGRQENETLRGENFFTVDLMMRNLDPGFNY
jgi:hypothetical protein